MAPRVLVVCLLTAASLGGCRPRRLDIDGARVVAEVNRALDRPEMDKVFEGLIEAVGADLAVGKGGEALFEALSDDPDLMAKAESLIAGAKTHPAMKRLVAELKRQNRRARPEVIEVFVMQRTLHVVAGTAFDHAWNAAWDKAMARGELKEALGRLDTLASNGRFVTPLNQAMQGVLSDRDFGRRLVARNGGRWPDRARATELVLSQVLSAQRLVAFYQEVATQPSIVSALARAVAEVLRAPAFQHHVKQAATALLTDEAFRKNVLDGYCDALAADGSPVALETALERALDGIMGAPALAAAIRHIIDRAFDDATLAPIGHRLAASLTTDPALKNGLRKLLTDW